MPLFFVPIVAFGLWAAVLFLFFPVLKLDLYLSDQLLASHFFISHLILILAWALSGPPAAAILSGLAALVSVYLCLGTREPAFLLEIAIYAALFIYVATYLQTIQQTLKDKQLAREKMLEELNWVREEAVKKDELKEALQKKVGHFLDLQQFSDELKGLGKVEEAAMAIVREACRVLTQAEACALYLVDETRQALFLTAATDTHPACPEGSLFDRWVVKKSQAILVEDAHNDFRFPAESRHGLQDRLASVCASPLMTENKVFGVVRVSAQSPGAFRPEDLRLLDLFSNVGAVTIRNLLLYERMDKLATHDSLTGLYVNRYFREKLAEEIQKSDQSGAPFSLLLMDIDFFKRYNDEYGHSAGDLVLKTIASLILECLGPGELAARYGGEEFAILLPGKKIQAAATAAEKIRTRIENHVFLLRRAERRVTASFGAVAFPEGGRTPEELIRFCDKKLYEAKHSGRNLVVG